jgi:hypothetical protein
MTGIIEFGGWTPDRDTFVATMQALKNPLTQEPLATLDEDGETLIPSACVRIDEIGPVEKVPAVLGEDGNIVTPALMVEGHHVNLVAYGALADLLTTGLPAEGTIFERTRILSLLGTMNDQPPQDGVPAAKEGTSGMKLFDLGEVSSRARIWA